MNVKYRVSPDVYGKEGYYQSLSGEIVDYKIRKEMNDSKIGSMVRNGFDYRGHFVDMEGINPKLSLAEISKFQRVKKSKPTVKAKILKVVESSRKITVATSADIENRIAAALDKAGIKDAFNKAAKLMQKAESKLTKVDIGVIAKAFNKDIASSTEAHSLLHNASV